MGRWLLPLAWVCACAAWCEPLSPAAAAAWDADLAVMAERYLACDRGLEDAERAAMADAIAALRAEIATLTDQEALVGVARICAMGPSRSGGADILSHPAMAAQLPIRFYWFDEGAYIVRAAPANADILLCRIRMIAGIAVERLQEEVAALIPGNPQWKRYMGPAYMSRPGVLAGLGLIDGAAAVPIVCDTIDGGQIEAVLESIPAGAPAEPWLDLAPGYADPAQKWMKAVDGPASLAPLPLQRTNENYWLKYLPEARTLYINYSRCAERPGDPMATFTAMAARAITDHDPRRVVVDLRYNAGGNDELGHRLMVRLVNTPAFADPGGTIVLSGRQTAGSAIYHAAYLKRMADAVIMGEAAGDGLAYRPAAHTVTLPNSQTVLYCAGSLRDFRLTGGEPKPGVLAVATIDPEPAIPVSWVDYLTGRDPALEAALAYAPATP